MTLLAKSKLRTILLATAIGLAGAAVAQTVGDDAPAPSTGLDLPKNLQIFGNADPNVRKPTAFVNKTVITGTDVDQRVNMIAALNEVEIKPDELQRLRVQVLRQLIDETLQIQEAKKQDVALKAEDIDNNLDRVAASLNRSRADLTTFLRSRGSSIASLRRQLEGELSWRAVLRRKVEPFVNVSDEEVNTIIERLKASQGAEEYHVKEVFLRADSPEQQAAVAARAQQMIDEIRAQRNSFEYYAANFSDATTKAVGGDLGWVRAAQLPDAMAANAQQMQVGQIAGPIDVGGGYSILWMVDKRRVLTADPRDAKLDLRQITVDFAPGTTKAQATAKAAEFAEAIKGIRGCGDVAGIAERIGAKVVTNDQNRVRDLPPQLQEIILRMQVGESTPAFGSPETGVRSLILCGRDDPQASGLPSADRLKSGLESDRVNRVAQRMLRDLRRDAVIEYK
jgi:peptidyl-prolyl cis-trans isomerase SurA